MEISVRDRATGVDGPHLASLICSLDRRILDGALLMLKKHVYAGISWPPRVFDTGVSPCSYSKL